MTTATMTPPPATDAPPEPLTPPERLLRIAGALSPGQRVTIDPVTWEEYEGLMDAREAAGRHFRLTYDQGSLEIMPTSNLHERLKKILALLIEGWLDETGGRYLSSGGLTIRRPDRQRGFEPDECYYVQNWAKVKGLGEIDFTSHPPDLTVEVEVSRTAAPRLP
ncbi:MAG TPA: Uma2 family endonuclease, partial [Urbifossiella sp.]|nr:Uma2 family endonuclease [Urbifossiella sp.]